MLHVIIPEREFFDEELYVFVKIKSESLQVEHSLVSLSKWESKWCKPFLAKDDKTTNETIDYIRCMTITKNVNPKVYDDIPNDIFGQISDYMNAPMTATWFDNQQNSKKNQEVITAELIYYWMITLNIPFECQKWHLNRLLTLIQVCNIKNQPYKKKSKKDIMNRNAKLNAARRKQLNTKG